MAAGPGSAPRLRSVTELTLALQGLVSDTFDDVLVQGEVTNLRRVASGHVYLSLKDAGAILPAVIWRTTAARMRFVLEDGLEVVCRGGLDVYPPHGKYQLIVGDVQPLGLGALQLAFEQLKKRLQAEGLFDPARKVPLPFLPRRIALVTSKTGAAVRDLVTVIHRRFPRVELVLVPVRVQGAGSALDVARGLALADRHARADVIVVGRGGGSLEDLQAFNEEPVARAIAACVTPVVSAVGHEIDVTIADLVADVRAATPSQAGELVVPVRDELLADLERRDGRLHHLVRMRLDRAWQRVEAAATRPVLREPVTRARAFRDRLGGLAARLAGRSPAEVLDRHRNHLDQLEARLSGRHPRHELDRRRGALGDLGARASQAVRGRFELAVAAYESLRKETEALSPLRVLDRGYSLTRLEDGALLKASVQARVGDRLTTELADGLVSSRVEAVHAHPPPAARAVPPASPCEPS